MKIRRIIQRTLANVRPHLAQITAYLVDGTQDAIPFIIGHAAAKP